MAQIYEEVVVIKLSKLIRADVNPGSILTEELQVALEQVAQELVGENVIVEVEKA
jgi:hypothetical protein